MLNWTPSIINISDMSFEFRYVHFRVTLAEIDGDELHWFELPDNYSGHTPKKSGVSDAADLLEIQFFCFRAGWQLAGAHSAFDYIFNNIKKDIICGLSLSGWKDYANEYIHGEIPPLREAIKHKKHVYDLFMKELFVRETHMDDEMKHYLCASIMRWIVDFEILISKEPTGEYKDIKKHPFIERIMKAVTDAGGNYDDVKTWHVEIVKDFNSNNAMSLPFQVLKEAGSNLVVDSRPLVSVVEDLARGCHGTQSQVTSLERTVETLNSTVQTLCGIISDQRKEYASLVSVLKTLVPATSTTGKQYVYNVF